MKNSIYRSVSIALLIMALSTAVSSCRKEEQVAVTGLTFPETAIMLTVGDARKLEATVLPESATNKAVTWASSEESVATVAAGVVTALSEGTTTITATTRDGGIKADCVVTVELAYVPVTGITLSEYLMTIDLDGKELQRTLEATVLPEEATDKTVTWSSGNNAIATIDENGVVTAVSEGIVSITVKTNDGNKEAVCAVTVVKVDPV